MLISANQSVDLLLVDVYMPDMGGLELIPIVRRSGPGTAIVAMSGAGPESGNDVLSLCGKLGARAVLNKPFDVERL